MINVESRLRAEHLIEDIEGQYQSVTEVNRDLNRLLVSFQANKKKPIYRWFKYKEGFSKPFLDYVFEHSNIKTGGVVLDPFAGSGSTCFAANERGLYSIGVELLPVGCHFIRVRELLHRVGMNTVQEWLHDIYDKKPWQIPTEINKTFSHLNITRGAFPLNSEKELMNYLFWSDSLPHDMRVFCKFIAFSILEDISYTRKDGQFLRWDYRAQKGSRKSSFSKGNIPTFSDALLDKCRIIESDLSCLAHNQILTSIDSRHNKIKSPLTLYEGSNFFHLNNIRKRSIDLVVTSPPYCNRYDYTRTYALELAYLNLTDMQIKEMRQSLLSCTVENRPKDFQNIIDPMSLEKIRKLVSESKALTAILNFLRAEKEEHRLNNNAVIGMIECYFFEMAVHIYQLALVIKRHGKVYMVNDNVRYNGITIPVDCILSSMAEKLGFKCLKIWVLPVGKGNSSQQMKAHGRSETRKCVYLWERQ